MVRCDRLVGSRHVETVELRHLVGRLVGLAGAVDKPVVAGNHG